MMKPAFSAGIHVSELVGCADEGRPTRQADGAGGLNPAACARETGIEVENHAMSTVMDYQELQNFWELCKKQ